MTLQVMTAETDLVCRDNLSDYITPSEMTKEMLGYYVDGIDTGK